MKKRNLICLLLAVLLLMTCLAGCGEQAAAPETTAAPLAAEPEMHTVTDVLDREISLKTNIERVVVTFNLEEYLAVTGEQGIDKLVGFSHAYWEGRRQDAWDTYTAAYPQLAETADVGYNDSISTETIISLAPDLVIMSSAVNYDYIEPHLPEFEEAGIPILFVNYHAQTIDMHRKSTEAIGAAMGQSERAAEISDFYAEQMNIITERVAGIAADAKLPKVYMEFSRGVGEYGNSWGKKMWGALIATCGGENVAYDFGDGNSVDVNPELVIAANPDVIVFTASPQTDISDNIVLGYGADRDTAVKSLEAYRGREGWSGLAAVNSGAMAAVYHDLSRHIFDFAGAQMLAKTIHPELFEDIDPESTLQEFFDKYMPVELSGVWMVSLAD